MGSEDLVQGQFQVRLTRKSIVQATNSSTGAHILTLSNLDLLSGRFPVTYFYFYKRPAIVETLKTSLAAALNHFHPFAGRIVQNPTTSEPEIICDNTGVLVVEAYANMALKELDFHNLNQFMQGKLVNIDSNFPVQVQVTEYTCGGTSLTFTFDHALGDANAFGKFLLSWSETAQKRQLSCTPDHRRNLHARNPPTYHPSLDQAFVKCTIEEIINMPTKHIRLKRLYHIHHTSIDCLQKLASSGGCGKTKIEAFSAYIWKKMAAVVNESDNTSCKMGWLVDGRERIGRHSDEMSNYIGNVLSLAVGEVTLASLKHGSLSEIAGEVHKAITRVANRDHFLDLIDWIECHRPGLMLSRAVLGREGPALVLSSGRRFPVAELDFGFGSPVLGTVCSTIERIGVGYMNQRPSARNNGSWTVSAILWPELAAALDSDPIFQPMSAGYLQL